MMISIGKPAKLIAILSLLLWSVACSNLQRRGEAPGAIQDGVFIHIGQGTRSPHQVLTALQMAERLSENRNVLVYFDIRGPEVVVKGSKDIQFGSFPSSHAQLKKLADRGVPLYCCPDSLPALGCQPEALMPGGKLGGGQRFFDFTKGRILTLDY
jgi:predicted peroxiredoxin